ncbi:protein takeout-like [Euwallacea fornicatus]|uniref:protein takeout-like n=1 Tax=Euwallacea fornicatus TaxID=995702 RepID=UPI00338F1C7F
MKLFLYLSVFISACYGFALPKCKVSSPDFDTCLGKAIQSVFHASKSGLPEYGLTTSFDPLIIPKLTIGTGQGAVQLTQYYTDLSVTGFSDITVENAHFDFKNLLLNVFAHFPKIVQKGHYTVHGKILTLPVNGDGQSTLELSNIAVNITFGFEKVKKNKENYLKVMSCVLDIIPQNMKVNFENLFNGNELMGNNINKVINEEWQAVFKDVKPSTDKTYGAVFKEYWQTFFDNVSMEKVFLK